MKVSQLSGLLRANVGKKDAKALRNEGRVPCVLYGQGSQLHFSAKSIEAEKLIFTPDVYQVNITGAVKHIDFYELDATKPVKVQLPVRLTGNSRGVLAGGKLLQVFRRVTVLGLPGDLPEAVTIDITKLRIGQSIRVGQIEANGLTILEVPNAVVVSVRVARGAAKGSDAGDDDDEE
jgi:large subunit ribosomal protein L25